MPLPLRRRLLAERVRESSRLELSSVHYDGCVRNLYGSSLNTCRQERYRTRCLRHCPSMPTPSQASRRFLAAFRIHFGISHRAQVKRGGYRQKTCLLTLRGTAQETRFVGCALTVWTLVG